MPHQRLASTLLQLLFQLRTPKPFRNQTLELTFERRFTSVFSSLFHSFLPSFTALFYFSFFSTALVTSLFITCHSTIFSNHFMTHLGPRHFRALTTETSLPSDSLLAFIPTFARPSPNNGPSYKYWPLSLLVMANLYWLGRALFSDHTDISASYASTKNCS
jgi:hypothetical protein